MLQHNMPLVLSFMKPAKKIADSKDSNYSAYLFQSREESVRVTDKVPGVLTHIKVDKNCFIRKGKIKLARCTLRIEAQLV